LEELIENPEREIDSTYLLNKRSHGSSLQPLGSTGTAAVTDGNAPEPKYHFEVHTVKHKMGHLMSADQKLQSIMRQAAGLSDETSIDGSDDGRPKQPVNDDTKLQGARSAPVAMEDAEKKSAAAAESAESSQGILNPRHQEELQPSDEDPSPVALARQNADQLDGPNASVHAASSIADVYFLAVVAGCSVAGIAGLLIAAVCWYRLHKKIKAASEVDYPAYGVTGPAAPASTSKDGRSAGSPGDRKLAQSAQMYHYQHQKQQMIASERLATDSHPAAGGSDVESEEENEEGDYTVFECPGLATNGEMEVRNPLFGDQSSSAADASSAQQANK